MVYYNYSKEREFKMKGLDFMTIRELREKLERLEKLGEGDREICVVSAQNCESISEYFNKWTTDIDIYLDGRDGTLTISD
jgi:hypothetical protein